MGSCCQNVILIHPSSKQAQLLLAVKNCKNEKKNHSFHGKQAFKRLQWHFNITFYYCWSNNSHQNNTFPPPSHDKDSNYKAKNIRFSYRNCYGKNILLIRQWCGKKNIYMWPCLHLHSNIWTVFSKLPWRAILKVSLLRQNAILVIRVDEEQEKQKKSAEFKALFQFVMFFIITMPPQIWHKICGFEVF